MVLRAGFSRIFALIFTIVGAPLLMLLTLSAAHSVREGVAWLWSWRARRRRVQEARPDNYESSIRGGSAISALNLSSGHQPSTPPSSPSPNGPSSVTSTWGQASTPQPKVPSMDDTLRGSRPSSSSATPSSSREGSVEEAFTVSRRRSSASSNRVNQNGHPRATTSTQVNTQGSFERPQMPQQSITTTKGISPPPCTLFFVLLLLHLLIGVAIFSPLQRWSVPSAIYVLGCNLLTIDHGGLGERKLIHSTGVLFLYVFYLFIGCIILASVVITAWPRLSTVISNTGKYLEVVKPVHLPR